MPSPATSARDRFASLLSGATAPGSFNARRAAREARGRASVRLTAADAKAQFAQQLRQIGYRGGAAGDGAETGPVGADELAAELADSWSPRDHPALYPSCSPHKVAVAVLHLCDYYKAEGCVPGVRRGHSLLPPAFRLSWR